MIEDHDETLGVPEVEPWKAAITEAERKFSELIGKFNILVEDSEQDVRAAIVNIGIDDTIVSSESAVLSKEIKNFLICESATDEEVEFAMVKIKDWRKRFERIKDKAYAIQRNSKCFNLDDPRVSNSQAAVADLEQQLSIAMDELKEEDTKRCLYSLARSKTASVKLPIFTGDQYEHFSKFRQ